MSCAYYPTKSNLFVFRPIVVELGSSRKSLVARRHKAYHSSTTTAEARRLTRLPPANDGLSRLRRRHFQSTRAKMASMFIVNAFSCAAASWLLTNPRPPAAVKPPSRWQNDMVSPEPAQWHFRSSLICKPTAMMSHASSTGSALCRPGCSRSNNLPQGAFGPVSRLARTSARAGTRSASASHRR